MYDGDRSHSRLHLLDSLHLTYPGWERDFRKAEDYHITLPDLFAGKIDGMKEKQKMYEGDRSHPNLQQLDALCLTYDDWQRDVVAAEEAHTSKPFMFREKLQEIKEKQKMHQGDRTHPRLMALDSLRLTYNGWQRDFKKAEEYHAKFPELFQGKLSGMKEKQKMFDGDRTHPNLVELDSLTLTYSGWAHDVAKAEEAHTSLPVEFRSRLFEIKEKQRMHDGNRSHSRLVAMDSHYFNYPGWERDVKKAELYHVRFPELFDGKLDGMKEKQKIYNGSLRRSSSSSPDDGNTLVQPSTNETVVDTQPSSSPVSTPGVPVPLTGECVVCLQNPKTHAFVPCGHLCICQNCVGVTIIRRKCPICRAHAIQAIKVFIA